MNYHNLEIETIETIETMRSFSRHDSITSLKTPFETKDENIDHNHNSILNPDINHNHNLNTSTKKIIIIGDDKAGRVILFNNLLVSFKGVKISTKVIKLKKINILKTDHNIQIIESTGYEEKSSKLELNDLSSNN